MEKAEARRKLKGLQAIVHNRADEEIAAVFADLQAFIDIERPAAEPKRTESKPVTRPEKYTRTRGKK